MVTLPATETTAEASSIGERLLGAELTALLTYDGRLAKATVDAGIPVFAPHDA
jgi:hypothetical protein